MTKMCLFLNNYARKKSFDFRGLMVEKPKLEETYEGKENYHINPFYVMFIFT